MLGGAGRERRAADAARPGPEDALTVVDGWLTAPDDALTRMDGGPAGADGGAGRPRPDRARTRGPRRDRSSPGGVRISPALRRLVVTPTFAAGLGLVVAAFLAANMSRTVLHFSAPIPRNQCTAAGCHAQEPHGGTLASARPGVHITPSVPAASGPVTALQPGGSQPGGSQAGSNQSGVNQPGGTASAAGASGGPQPSVSSRAFSITYQQVEQWPGGFADQITIHGLNGTRAQAWSLAFAYPGAHIAGVQGARWEPGRAGAGVAQGVSWPGWGQTHRSVAAVRLMVIVEGRPAAPSGCAFDGQLCTFGGSPATP
ncbi:MAG TPA: cellulose binding domain-containing protein [Streptosporangiaceae bacterium]|nr:cellulose binding domain-containing protein [Streptosporangiaceae bacterium]